MKKRWKKVLSVLLTASIFCAMLPGAVASAATFYTGITLSRYDYDYAPSVMYGDGTQIKMWWGGGTGSGDAVYYSTLSQSGWSTPQKVLTKSSSGWDRCV